LLDDSAFMRAQISKFLNEQKHTRLSSVFDAINALEQLDQNPAAAESLAKLKNAVKTFVEDEPQVDPKKKKAKAAVAPEPRFKDAVAQLSSPIDRATVVGIRDRIAHHASEALLGQVYALSAYLIPTGVSLKPDLVRTHDFGALAWSAT